jgi:protein arginine kinase activator
MKVCEECGSRVATIHLMQTNGAEQKSLFLCEECAKKQGISVTLDEGFFSVSPGPVPDQETDSECPECETKLSEFTRTGRLGCPDCYEAFAATIDALLRESRGSPLHTGKKYRAASVPDPGKSDAAMLRLELAAAIKKEEFERAALLRDALHDLHLPEPE